MVWQFLGGNLSNPQDPDVLHRAQVPRSTAFAVPGVQVIAITTVQALPAEHCRYGTTDFSRHQFEAQKEEPVSEQLNSTDA